MIITIKGIEEKTKGEYKWIAVTDENGKVRNIFPNQIENWKDKVTLIFEGNTVELVAKQSDKVGNDGKKLWNIVDIKPSSATEAVQKDQSADFAISSQRSKEIKEGMAFNAVAGMVQANIKGGRKLYDDIELPLAAAFKMRLYEWLNIQVEKK